MRFASLDCGLVDHRVALAEREADQRPPGLLVVVEDEGRDGDDARALRQLQAERAAVVEAERADVGGDEVGAGGFEHGEARRRAARRTGGRAWPGGRPVKRCEVRVGQAERERDGGLERRAADEGEELLGGLDGGDELPRAGRPADLPAREGEGLAGGGDRDRALRHPGQRGERDVLAAVEDEVLVDLVGDGEDVALAAVRGDQLQLGAVEDLARGVVGRVEEDEPGAVA